MTISFKTDGLDGLDVLEQAIKSTPKIDGLDALDQAIESTPNAFKRLQEKVDKEKNKNLFLHVLTVMRNREKFSKEEYSVVERMYTETFDYQEKKQHLKSLPAKTPTVKQTREYFFGNGEEQ